MSNPTAATIPRILRERFRSGPRFGYSNTFSDYFSQDDDVAMDYVKGLLACGLFILSMFLCWVLLLLVFKCLGRKKVGFLSGAPFHAMASNTDNHVAVNPWISRGRCIVAFSCGAMFIFAILLTTVGLGNIDVTTTTIGDGAVMGFDYFSNAQGTLVTADQYMRAAASTRDEVVAELIQFLGALRDAKEQYDAGNVEEAARITIQATDDLGDFLRGHLMEINRTLMDGQQTCVDVKATTDEINLRGVQWGVGLVMTIVPTLLLGCLWWTVSPPPRKHQQQMNACRTWFIVPLFSLLVVLSFVLCSAICIAGLVNADFCSGGEDLSPDSTILNVLIEQGSDPDGLEFRAIEYLVRQCDAFGLVRGTPLADVEGLKRSINSTLFDIGSLMEEITAVDTVALSQQVGYNVTVVQLQLLRLRQPLLDVLRHLVDFIHSLACRPIYAVYHTVAHKAVCTESYTGLFWVFMSLIWISFFGLLALTFGSALYPVLVPEPFLWDLELKEKQEGVDEQDCNNQLDGNHVHSFRAVSNGKDDSDVAPVHQLHDDHEQALHDAKGDNSNLKLDKEPDDDHEQILQAAAIENAREPEPNGATFCSVKEPAGFVADIVNVESMPNEGEATEKPLIDPTHQSPQESGAQFAERGHSFDSQVSNSQAALGEGSDENTEGLLKASARAISAVPLRLEGTPSEGENEHDVFFSVRDSTADPRSIEPRPSWEWPSSPISPPSHDSEQGVEAVYSGMDPEEEASDLPQVKVHSIFSGRMPS
ncbi:expressed unknown protein [Seminavis robusta]|uniref:Uncharacterized protein n=1 Tax=Seminavis robusta TaxID=568900 RepID=A0A9N8DZM8_9STRA|nr:expressed unknown protein [Seminavis robusta]|eukprot:Sro506_g156250.1 n/a (762) ;mRNA; f:3342-5844